MASGADSKPPALDEGFLRALLPKGDLRAMASRPEGLRVRVVGGSMSPTLQAGDGVVVRSCDYLWPGDVVLFEVSEGRANMLHRTLFEVPSLGWIFQAGDADGQVAITHRRHVIGCADVPRSLPPVDKYLDALALGLRLLGRVAARGDWLRPLRPQR